MNGNSLSAKQAKFGKQSPKSSLRTVWLSDHWRFNAVLNMAFEDCRGSKIFKHQHTNAVADSGTKKILQSIKAKLYTIHQVLNWEQTFFENMFEGFRLLFPAFFQQLAWVFAVFALILRLCIFFLFLLPFLMKITLPTYLTLKTPDTLCLGWGLASAGRDEQILRSFPETIVVEAWQWVVGNIHKKKCSLPSQVSTVCKYLAPSSNKRKTQLSLNFARAKVWLQKLQQPFWGFKSPRGVQFFALWMPHKIKSHRSLFRDPQSTCRIWLYTNLSKGTQRIRGNPSTTGLHYTSWKFIWVTCLVCMAGRNKKLCFILVLQGNLPWNHTCL